MEGLSAFILHLDIVGISFLVRWG